ECVGQNQAPKVKASFGASRNQIPVVSKYLIGICVGALFYTLLNGGVSYMALQFGMVPEAIANGQWWRLVSAAFLHGGILHLAFNMYALYWLGPQLEQLLGHVRFASIYMLSAIGGNVISYYFSDIATVSVGASGAIFGLMTATIVIGRELRADVSQLMTLLVLNVVIGFASAGIDWRAHLGGAIVGAATGYLQTHSGKNLRFSGMTVIVVILLALVFVRNQQVLNALIGQ
ncbi:MAG: hypothetical protein RL228_674, partial [Actinomycetota bacterium]